MQPTPEQAANLLIGTSPVQMVILVFLGIVMIIGIFVVGRWIMDMRLSQIDKIPDSIESIKNSINEIQRDQIEIKSSMWSKEDMKRTIQFEIAEHQKICPGYLMNCKKFKDK